MRKTEELYRHAKQRIPGGVQLLSKRPEIFAPDQWPAYATQAKGCEIWDLDNAHYYDMTKNGIGSCLLGFADPDVSQAVINRIQNGSMCTLNYPEEVVLADKLCELHPWAENVRFARTGGEICAIAIRIARSTTGRDLVAICGYHGWTDWYVSANLGDNHQLDGVHLPGLSTDGVPRHLQGSALTFNYNDTEAFDKLIRDYGDRLACVIMEPIRHEMPPAGFLEHVRDEIHRVGGLLIYDEITIGWHMTLGGSHRLLDIQPDMAIFAKAMGNGHPIAAVIGTKDAMDGAHTSFISSTYWTEGIGPTAALATISKMEQTRVWEHVAHIGTIAQKDWKELASKHGLSIICEGIPSVAEFSFAEYKQELKTLYVAKMLHKGFLADCIFYPTLAHTDEIMAKHRDAVDQVFSEIADIIKKGGKETILEAIGGPVAQVGFKRLIR